MTLLNILLCIFLCLGYSKGAGLFRPNCGANEEIDECPTTCEYDICPKNNLPPKACVKRKPCPPAACKCIFNYRRADNGTCIPTTECPPFACDNPKEEYDPCPPYCPTDSCKQATENGECPYPGYFMTVYCTPACRCYKGYWRKNGVCVPYEKCRNTVII